MAYLYPHRYKSGRRRLCERDGDDDGVAWRGDCQGRPQSRVDRHQASAAQQADPERSQQEDSELQGGISDRRNQYGHSQLLPGEQEGD